MPSGTYVLHLHAKLFTLVPCIRRFKLALLHHLPLRPLATQCGHATTLFSILCSICWVFFRGTTFLSDLQCSQPSLLHIIIYLHLSHCFREPNQNSKRLLHFLITPPPLLLLVLFKSVGISSSLSSKNFLCSCHALHIPETFPLLLIQISNPIFFYISYYSLVL